MARWDKIQSKGNVDDRRGLAGTVGGIGITGLIGLLAINFLLGGDASDALNIISQVPVQQQIDTSEFEGEDEYEQFSQAVLGSLNSKWSSEYEDYREPRLVLFRDSTESACGGALSAFGPHYCQLDETIYLDETFFDKLEQQFGAEGGDVAEAYVIAHEVGHHIQKLQGVFDKNPGTVDNDTKILIELQADCYAGVWASELKEDNILEPGEIKEAMDAAAAVGDDHIQKTVDGRVSPETWTHGSSEMRVNSFMSGYESGNIGACNKVGYLR